MDLAQLFERLLDLPDGLLYAVLFGAALLENLVPPIPGDSVVVFGGYLAGLGRLSPLVAYALVTLGSWCGFMVYYLLGRWLGRTRVHDLLGRWMTAEALGRGERWVRRHGHWVVLANRLLSGLRSVISLGAGFVGLRADLVAVLALVSSALWNLLLVAAGFWVGDEWPRVRALLHTYDQVVLAAGAALGLFLLLRWWWRRVPQDERAE